MDRRELLRNVSLFSSLDEPFDSAKGRGMKPGKVLPVEDVLPDVLEGRDHFAMIGRGDDEIRVAVEGRRHAQSGSASRAPGSETWRR